MLERGGEAAVHVLREAFCDEDTESMLLIDTTNAFNSLNRAVALYNIQQLSAIQCVRGAQSSQGLYIKCAPVDRIQAETQFSM